MGRKKGVRVFAVVNDELSDKSENEACANMRLLGSSRCGHSFVVCMRIVKVAHLLSTVIY